MVGMEDLKAVLKMTRTDLWGLIETALSVAARDYREELRVRRDGYVELLYVNPGCGGGNEKYPGNGAEGAAFLDEDGYGEDENDGVGGGGGGDDEHVDVNDDDDDEESKVLAIKELIEDPDQEEGALVDLLQNLADMDITFKALQETDIGRHVNALRKHPSNEVRRLVRVLVRKWKDLVDDWVKQNQNETAPASIITDVDSSPLQYPAKNTPLNGNNVPEFGYSPNPHNGSSGSDKNISTWEPEPKPKLPLPPPRRDPIPNRQNNLLPPSSSAPPKSREQQKDSSVADPELLASTRRRLHENYQEAHNGTLLTHPPACLPACLLACMFVAISDPIFGFLPILSSSSSSLLNEAKKQRTIQVMDIHDIPKPKNAYFPRNRQGKHHR